MRIESKNIQPNVCVCVEDSRMCRRFDFGWKDLRIQNKNYTLHTNDDDDDQKGKLSTDSNINLYIFRNNNNEK